MAHTRTASGRPSGLGKEDSRRGSILLAVVIFVVFSTAVLATLLTSLVTEYRMNVLHRLGSSALAIAEYGAQHAIWSLNEYDTEADWQAGGWALETDPLGNQILVYTIDVDGSDTVFTLEDRETGHIRIILRPVNQTTARVIAEGRIDRPAARSTSQRQLVVVTARTYSPFIGLIAQNSMSFAGQPSFDSYNSDIFPHDYDNANKGQNVSVGSVNSAAKSVDLGKASIYGNVVSGAIDPLGSGAVTGGKAITGSVVGDFNMAFPDVTPPETSGWSTSFD